MELILSRNRNTWYNADPKNDPTYPIKNRTNELHDGNNWERPTRQTIDIEVLLSNERPNVIAVFGTSVQPSGLSGMIRRFAFKYSELVLLLCNLLYFTRLCCFKRKDIPAMINNTDQNLKISPGCIPRALGSIKNKPIEFNIKPDVLSFLPIKLYMPRIKSIIGHVNKYPGNQ